MLMAQAGTYQTERPVESQQLHPSGERLPCNNQRSPQPAKLGEIKGRHTYEAIVTADVKLQRLFGK
jgi:hypothetical protein